jgi:hypothetical protein
MANSNIIDTLNTTNSTIIAALNATSDPALDKIITDMADIECGFGSYERAVRYAASRSTFEELMKLRDAYEKLAETMQHVVTVKQILFRDGCKEL